MYIKSLFWLILIATVMALAIHACGDDDDDDEQTVDCRTPLTIYYDTCGYTVSFDDIEPASFDDALQSCTASGKMWNMFIHCYRVGYRENGEDCQAWAECLPEHGFIADDDTNTADDDATDDDAVDDDATDDDVTDDDAADDDATDDDATDDDATDDDAV